MQPVQGSPAVPVSVSAHCICTSIYCTGIRRRWRCMMPPPLPVTVLLRTPLGNRISVLCVPVHTCTTPPLRYSTVSALPVSVLLRCSYKSTTKSVFFTGKDSPVLRWVAARSKEWGDFWYLHIVLVLRRVARRNRGNSAVADKGEMDSVARSDR